MDITLGYHLSKPIISQVQCDTYAAMANAVNAHNTACSIGDTLWSIKDTTSGYEIVESGPRTEIPVVNPTPTNTELAQQLTDLQLALCELYERDTNNG